MLVKSFALSLARLKWSVMIKTSKAVGKTLFSKYLLGETEFIFRLLKLIVRIFSEIIVTNVTISTTLSGVGDALQQQYDIVTGDNPNLTWDKKRTLDMSATGTVVGG